MSKFTDKAVPRRNPDITWREEDENIFIGSTDGRILFSLDSVGADMWRLADGKQDLGKIIDQLIVIYEVDRETIQSDIDEFLEELKSNGLILID